MGVEQLYLLAIFLGKEFLPRSVSELIPSVDWIEELKFTTVAQKVEIAS
jgi:hypothetical protein